MESTSHSVLVLGAHGLIGRAIAANLISAGHRVRGTGRSAVEQRRADPAIDWRRADIADLTDPVDWAPLLDGIDIVVNAAGALQDGPADRLEALHHESVRALAAAAAGADVLRIVQISAPAANGASALPFYASKGRGDAALLRGGVPAVILRPGLVLGDAAYGGSAMLRALAAFPLVQPIVHADAPVRTVPLDDVARAVRMAVEGQVPDDSVVDLVEDHSHRFAEVVAAHRRWLGLAPAPVLRLPMWLAMTIARLSDAAAWAGWRSPLRTTALAAMAAGIEGDPARWRTLSGGSVPGLHEQLAARPASVQERWFAPMYLALPLVLATLSVFWVASGVIALVRLNEATALLDSAGWPAGAARTAAAGGAILEVALGLALLVRRWARTAALGMVLVSVAYLAGGSIWLPRLWVDPLGPLLKVLPGLTLALMARILLVNR